MSKINIHKQRVLISAVNIPPITINLGGVEKMITPAKHAANAKHVDNTIKARIILDFTGLQLPVGGGGVRVFV
ncbi:hypothetical protein C834K_0725 [Chlamydia poikilotherma]|uniref:Uncharacterized protein n=1 Tax=Chlamydia poikilotherma TaxID=1967783 RepID=A0A3B0PN12_9CHLA|nr:hypothetical protein [Chlamydia poikilotherma]SYX09169.1 hypothetical protein C834K_0725 [Chlamydia poikilotherma]